MEVSSVLSDKDKCVYTACYCEENVWKLCHMIKEACCHKELKNCWAVFISNERKQIPLWHQKASKNAQRMVIWDYHVIMVYKSSNGSLVYDLDTELTFPCRFLEYADACIGEESLLKKEFCRRFRVIGANDFLTKFASDRSHMLRKDGTWLSPSPNYPPIHTAESKNNLQNFISMEESNEFGMVFNLGEFRQYFLNS